MAFLTSASITFDTHGDAKEKNTDVFVFLKNRLNNSLTPQNGSDFISHWLARQRYEPGGDIGDRDRNPFLAYGLLWDGIQFDDPSSHTFQLQLVSGEVTRDDIVLPQIDIHIRADGQDRWIFDYTANLTFDDRSEFSFTSATDGVYGIILDQDRRNYSGIGIENPLRTLPIPVPTRPATDAVLKTVTLEFSSLPVAGTVVNVHIVNRLSATSVRDIAIGENVLAGHPGTTDAKTVIWSRDDDTLASDNIMLADMMLPVFYIRTVPSGGIAGWFSEWIFDYRVTLEFENSHDFAHKTQLYSSRINGVILDQDRKHAGVYQGRPFPTVTPPTAPALTFWPVDHTDQDSKPISIPFVNRKLGEFVNDRTGPITSHDPPLRILQLRPAPFNTLVGPIPIGPIGPLPESYADLQSITAGNDGEVHYVSSPMSLGQMYHTCGDTYIAHIDCQSITIGVDAADPAPLSVALKFAPGGFMSIRGNSEEVHSLSITLKLTLDKATISRRTPSDTGSVDMTVVDLFSWVDAVKNADPVSAAFLLDAYLNVDLDLGTTFTPGDLVRAAIQSQIYAKITTPDPITKRTLRDDINSRATSWLLGGVADDEHNIDDNNAVIESIAPQLADPELGIAEDRLLISYTGPRNVFVPQPPVNWPPADFSPGPLSNIDHIVVLMMENRSFDHMLGYLSLPTLRHGMAREDVDGLKGGEFNPYNGQNFNSFELTDTVFAPDPPHGYEPVHHAINGGRMDGFVQSYAEEHGAALAANIMGYHTGKTVPIYDALARDFAIGHRWFASHPGPTFCNRFYTLTGRLNLDSQGFWEFDNSKALRPVYTPTIFDHLTGAYDPQTGQTLTWRYFEHGYCFLRFFEKYTFDHEHVVAADDPQHGFFASARAGQLPNVSFIDPHFIEYPPDGNCDGPPADVWQGQRFVQKVVEAVVASPSWNKTLLLIVYDEHGGFFDHVAPSAAARVSDDLPITTHGVRVPAFVISPWVGAGTVFGHDGSSLGPGLHFDHTSIAKTIARRFLPANPPYMGARYAAANDLSAVIGVESRQPQFLPFIRYRLRYNQSGKMLGVKDASRAPGTMLWQSPGPQSPVDDDLANPLDFSFEDAGDGFVYIRSHVSNLYVTAKSPGPVSTTGAPGGGVPASPAIIQDVKYAVGHVGPPGVPHGPQLQKWMLTPAGPSLHDRDVYWISNQAYPGLVLQPAQPLEPGSPLILGLTGAGHGIHHGPRTWTVTSPLFDEHLTNI